MKKNIFYIISNLNVGGAELSLLKIVQGLNHKYQFTVISLTESGKVGDQLTELGINVISLGLGYNLNSLFIPFKLFKLLKKYSPDIVHTWMYHSDFIGGIISKLAGIRNVFWNVRNTELLNGISIPTRLLGFVNSFLSYFIPDRIVLVSESSKNFHKKIFYNSKKMTVISNGFDVDLIVFNNLKRYNIRTNYGVSNDAILIGSVGRFNEYKNHENFIISAVILLEKYLVKKDLKFMLIGRGITTSYLLDLIPPIFHSNFILIDERPDVIDYYSAFDVFCLHSKSEGFPNVLCEAMLVGIPCVSTNVGDSKLILNDDRFMCPILSPDCLADKLSFIINLAESEIKSISYKNRQHIRDNYSIKNVILAYDNLYSCNN